MSIKNIKFGEYVRAPAHGYTGRVYGAEYITDTSWLDGQSVPPTPSQRVGLWLKVLAHNGGSILASLEDVEIIKPFDFNNPYAEETFEEKK